MNIINNAKRIWILALTLMAALVSCKKNNNDNTANQTSGQYFIAANVGTGTYLLLAESLESGSVTTVGNGVEIPRSYTNWVTNGTTAAIGLIYAQGDPGIGISYGLNASGALAPVGNEFQITSRFTTYGPFQNYIVTAVSGQTLTNGQIGSRFDFIDLNNGNSLTEKTIGTENFTGHGGIATFSGIEEFGDGEFLTSVVMSEPQPATATGGSSIGAVTYPDSVWVAAMDANLQVKRIYRDNRISYSAGRMRSQTYSQLGKDDNGNVYVFSGSYDGTTTKPAGALLIRSGATIFDPNFYFNIQEKSGGYRFRKVFHITQDYFLLEMYNDLVYSSTSPATQFAIVKMSDLSFRWLTSGFPDKSLITGTGLPFSENGKLYLPVTATNASPTIYAIDPVAGTARAGLVIEAEGVSAVSRLSY
ncbi:DUF4374 domain-containing protein [Pedobacter sp. AW1-32]|uniref:DUF4374 domain-containing protein n=1 Tax=Pedobacter sp. AW1-32 TaxID=3383026 RepID=UPI003FF021D0